MGVGITEDTPRTVDVEDHRQDTFGAGRLDDPGPRAARGTTRHGDPLLVDLRLADVSGLHLVHGLAALYGTEVEEVRRRVGGLGERLGGGFQYRPDRLDNVGHG